MKTYLLYHEPGDQLRVTVVFHGLGGVHEFPPAREQVGGVFAGELGHDGGYGLVQQGAVGAHVLAVAGLGVSKYLADP